MLGRYKVENGRFQMKVAGVLLKKADVIGYRDFDIGDISWMLLPDANV